MRLFFVVVVLSIGFIPAFAQPPNNLTSTIKELDELLSKQIQLLNEIKSSSSCQENECANITSQLTQMNDDLLRINESITLSGIPNLLFSAISMFIAGIAVITAFVTAHYSRKQFKQSSIETQMRLRPWLGLAASKFAFYNCVNSKGEIKTLEEWNKMSLQERSDFQPSVAHYYLDLKNYGQIPGKAKCRNFFSIKTPNKEDILTKDYDEPFLIMPNEVRQYFLIDHSATTLNRDSDTFYVVFEVTYDFDYANPKKFGFIAEFQKDHYKIVIEWDEKTF